ncbi:MAG: hypothetical protein EOP34_10525 [Rickettsiales bacterium]|nr:MAG: hypothetical protein EOP34_10525 [Rickettsiales bacterium]
MYLNSAKSYNKLKITLDRKTHKTEEEVNLLSQLLDKSKELKFKKEQVEKKLNKLGVDPSQQYIESSSGSGSSSGYDSESSQPSNSSQNRANKRVKYSTDNNQ